VEFEGKKLTIRMQVEQHRVMAHADRKGLEELPGKIRGLRQIFIVHGEAGKQVSLEKHLGLKYKVSVPGIGETHVV
jgi:Cft2 family RNA processing exonuclease